ncbi:MAG TPA: cbb3-type cytochrome c oxidase subunit I [Dehalococcoidia bacterium]|nr:cbb3-type cytochrome c oxidase subunit I [Dehalococcoidia bacterium]
MVLLPLLNGVLFGGIGFVAGAALAAALRVLMGLDPFSPEALVTVGYALGLVGWLLGVGLWDTWAREWLGLRPREAATSGWGRYLRFSTDHKVIGLQYLVTFVVVLLLGGLLAVLIRLELMDPAPNLLSVNNFNTAMSLHGIFMVAVAVATIIGGLGNFLVPLLIGAEDVAFPRVNALSYWIVPPVAVLLLASPLMGGFDSGWTAYPPLSVINASGQLLFLLAFLTFGLSSILGGVNFLATITTLRAPGMTWSRMPIFVWSVFAAALISLTATQFVAAGLLMVILDRVAGTSFFDAVQGGNALLYEHVFWFYSHPAVYIMILPAFGVVLEILAHFSRKPLFAYGWVVASFLVVVGLSFLVWAHHLFTSGMSDYLHLPFMITTELISIPTGMVFLAGLGTIWRGRLWLTTPMLFALGFLFNFVVGGVTGIFLADVPTDIQLQDTYFVVAHFHYTIMGGEVFAILAGVYYWFPKMTGRMFHDGLGKIHFWWVFIAYHATFIPMFRVGLHGMNRRNPDYPAELTDLNVLISVMAFILAASFLPFGFNLVYSWLRGPRAVANPWHARTLEWQTASPPPVANFAHEPQVVGGPYDYGVPGSRHGAAPVAGASDRGGEPQD